MPKVETNKWGTNINVSNKIGDKNYRYKRELPESNRRRVIKKLVRVQPLTEEPFEPVEEVTTRRYRKRLRIKKKKKRLLTPSSETETIPTTVKPRRKIVITRTRKRIILTQDEKTDTLVIAPTVVPSNLLREQSNYDENVYEDDYQNDSEENYEYDEEDEDDSEEYYDDDDSFTESAPVVTIRNELSLERDSEGTSISETQYVEDEAEDLADGSNFIHSSEHSDYEPFDDHFLRTTVLSSTEFLTTTLTQSRLRTYTFVVTRVSGSEVIVTSTTEVRPQVKTTTLTESLTKFTTLTLLDLDATETLTDIIPTLDHLQPDLPNRADEGRSFSEEPRYNLATRVMSNGVEVIVAGDKTSLPGKPDAKRVLTNEQKHVTLKPSTVTDQMMMLVPQETSKVDISNSDQFITKTCLTTFTYITTYLEGSTTAVSSHEQVVSNVATEAREKGKILPTPTVGITLTQNTNLSVGVFHTTYTYLNTILDGEQPLVISSEHTVANTVTAPDDYFSLLQPSETPLPAKDTNTYYSTIGLEKTLFEGDRTSVISTKEVVTQVVITESVPPRATSVMTSYIALDVDENPSISSTDVLKTYFVTYTYYNTVTEGGKEVVETKISTASDVVTEQLYILPKKKATSASSMQIQAAKSYLTTFTYYTTLLREENKVTSTIVSSRTSVVENLVTEAIDPTLLNEKYLTKIGDAIGEGSKSVVMLASLQNGHTVEITAFPKKPEAAIAPSKVMKIERTKNPEAFEPSSPSVITGSTIVFVDDDPFANLASTPVLKLATTFKTATTKTQHPKSSTEVIKSKPSTKREKSKSQIAPTKNKESHSSSPTNQASDLLGLGSLNLQALTPVFNAMAGLISTNLKSNRRHDTEKAEPDSPNRSPIYIPVRGLADDFEIAESQNIASFDWIEDVPLLNGGIAISPGEIITTNSDVIVGKPGRIGPRVPAIPLSRESEPIGMKPPPVEYGPSNKDDYVGPPPPPLPNKQGSPNRKEHFGERVNPFYRIHSKDQTDHVADYNMNEVGQNQETIPNKYNSMMKQSYPIYAPKRDSSEPGPPINNRPIVLPEVIERSTGQPLLVDIQPSQVAFVNIPYNRTTALIYGGSTEPQRNGPYFEDPAPYPKPELSGVEIDNGVPQVAREQTVHADPDTSANQKVMVNIKPTKPFDGAAAPISYELVHQGNDFNAHVINHGPDNQYFDTGVSREQYHRYGMNGQRWEDFRYRKDPQVNSIDSVGAYPKYVKGNEIGVELSETMVPPPPRPVGNYNYRRPLPIPLGSGPMVVENKEKSPSYQQQQFKPNRIRFPEEEDTEEDIDNGEDGVFQESNSRPLFPGEVPIEILKIRQGKKNETVKKTVADFNSNKYIPVISQNARPFATVEPVSSKDPTLHKPGPDNPYRFDINNHQNANTVKEDESAIAIRVESPNHEVKINHNKSNKNGIKYLIQNTSQKPILIFIDDNNDTTKSFFHHNKPDRFKVPARPSVTSLPIDIHRVEQETPGRSPSQTETPFEIATTKAPRFKIRYPETKPKTDLNTGEVTVSTISDLEILKPPPTLEPAANEVVRIKHYPAGEHAPNAVDTEFVPAPLAEMVPPPITTATVVIGMSPPPLTTSPHPVNKTVYSMQIDTPRDPPRPVLTTTEKTRRTRRPLTTSPRPVNKTVYSMQIDTPRDPPRPVLTTTEKTRRTRRPYTRRPSATTTRPATNRKPVFPFKNRTPSVVTTTEENTISPSPSIKTKPSMQVIIGHPNLDLESSSPVSVSEPTKDSATSETVQHTLDLMAVESGIPTEELKKRPVLMTHHAGNEVKAVDEQSAARSKLLAPTKFITYTLTSTVTVTKTTVVEASGMRPSTVTIVVTETERSTVIDTITEVRTLVRPTSVVETVTATVQRGSSLYPADAYGSPYASVRAKPVDLEEFVIRDGDHPTASDERGDANSILIVMTNTNNDVAEPDSARETQDRDEVAPEKVSDVRIAGIFVHGRPEEEKKKKNESADRCYPECLPGKNELCQKLEGSMRCVCRPGFARMFPDRPCLPTYTFNGRVTLERIGKDPLHFYDDLKNSNSSEFLKFAHATREALDRMVMQSDLRDIFHGVQVHSFEPVADSTGIVSKFYLQLSDNIEENRLEQIFQKYLQSNNNSLGGTDIFASAEREIETEDFDECSDPNFHDCSDNSRCFNLRGTYTCSCKEGFSDLSENALYPGRVCSADLVGCDTCSYHGTCYAREGDRVLCECFQWYAGEWCQINLKVLLIALATLGTILFVLLLVCIVATCVRRQPRKTRANAGIKFLPQRNADARAGTADRRAMIHDTSSEDSRSETNETLPFVQADIKKSKNAPKKISKVSLQLAERKDSRDAVPFPDQKDRSLTVMIPRAKYHPSPAAAANLMNYTSFDARQPSVPAVSNEAKLLSYLDAGPSPNKSDAARKFSAAASESAIEDASATSRKTSGGALVSAGFEVSATVVNNAGTMETTRGTEADRSENATLVQRISADLRSSAGSASHFNTLRKSLMDDNIGTSTDWLDIVPRVMTVSEARSFDETTIPPPMRVLRTDFDSKPSSQHQNDEANTMAERDLGSTFLLPHTHLYKPDRRESDASGFESL